MAIVPALVQLEDASMVGEVRVIRFVLLQPPLASCLGTAPVVVVVRGLAVAAFEDVPGRTTTAHHAGASFPRMLGGLRKEGVLIAGIRRRRGFRVVVAILQLISAVAAPLTPQSATAVPAYALLIHAHLVQVADLPAHSPRRTVGQREAEGAVAASDRREAAYLLLEIVDRVREIVERERRHRHGAHERGEAHEPRKHDNAMVYIYDLS